MLRSKLYERHVTFGSRANLHEVGLFFLEHRPGVGVGRADAVLACRLGLLEVKVANGAEPAELLPGPGLEVELRHEAAADETAPKRCHRQFPFAQGNAVRIRSGIEHGSSWE